MAVSLRAPGKVAVSSDGTLVAVADSGHDRMVVVDLMGAVVAEHQVGREPQGVAFGPEGEIFVCEPSAARVLRLDVDGGRAVVMDGLRAPWDVTVALDERIVVADAGGHQILGVGGRATPHVLAGSGRAGLEDGVGKHAQLDRPSGVAAGAQGVFVADTGRSAVRVLDRFGRLATLVGNAGGEAAWADGPPRRARMRGPRGVAAAPDGSSVYVADTGNSCLRLWSGVDGELRTIDGPDLRAPGGLAVLPDGRLVVADTGHDRVVVVDLARGSVRILVG